MNGQRSGTSSVLAAVILSALTLSVFASARNSGPESAVRRFGSAVLTGDVEEAAFLLMQPINDPYSQELSRRAMVFGREANDIQVFRSQASDHRILVTVLFQYPRHLPVGLGYVLMRTPNGWKIDARESLAIAPRMIGG